LWGVPRKLRLQYPGAIDHVMNRGDQRQAILSPWMNISGSVLANYWHKRPTPPTEATAMRA